MMRSKKLFLISKSMIRNKLMVKKLKLTFHKKSKEILWLTIRTQQDHSLARRMKDLNSCQDLLNRRYSTNSLTYLLLTFLIRLPFQVMLHPSFQTMTNLVFLRTQGSSWNRDRLLMRLRQMDLKNRSMVWTSKSSMQEANLIQQDLQMVS
jgi:hypothetical protein